MAIFTLKPLSDWLGRRTEDAEEFGARAGAELYDFAQTTVLGVEAGLNAVAETAETVSDAVFTGVAAVNDMVPIISAAVEAGYTLAQIGVVFEMAKNAGIELTAQSAILALEALNAAAYTSGITDTDYAAPLESASRAVAHNADVRRKELDMASDKIQEGKDRNKVDFEFDKLDDRISGFADRTADRGRDVRALALQNSEHARIIRAVHQQMEEQISDGDIEGARQTRDNLQEYLRLNKDESMTADDWLEIGTVAFPAGKVKAAAQIGSTANS